MYALFLGFIHEPTNYPILCRPLIADTRRQPTSLTTYTTTDRGEPTHAMTGRVVGGSLSASDARAHIIMYM